VSTNPPLETSRKVAVTTTSDRIANSGDFDFLEAVDDLLSDVGLTATDAGGSVSIAGQDPIVSARHRLGACIGIPLVAGAVASVAFHRRRSGPAQDLHLDLRQAVHTINPGAFWHPTLNGEVAPHPLVLDNPFLVAPYRTADNRWVMATAVYPHLVAKWCRFLDVPPDGARVAEAIAKWDALELEETASDLGLPVCIVRSPEEWRVHDQGLLLASQPVIGLERIGDAPPRQYTPSERPFDDIRILSFTHAVAGPTVGRTLAEQGADVLGVTRPNDYEHEHIYAEANVGSRSAYVDLGTPIGQERAASLLAKTDIIVNNHRWGSLERLGLDPRELARRYPGIVYVSVSCYGTKGPWASRGGFDMNGSAVSGLLTIEGSAAEPRFPITFLINDYITGYMGAIGAMAALVKRATEGGSWHVNVNLTRSAMWCGSLGFVDPSHAGLDEEHRLRDPEAYDAPSPLGDVHMVAPPVRFSHTPPAWPDPILVPRGSSVAEWRPGIANNDPNHQAEEAS
jgi:crotonobetainyl-CoA:carnitine CoA-transferase CaiB-like acyl-CoA transferase